jgi:tripartite-type tricarboxylate transporter receptor subunit TctC
MTAPPKTPAPIVARLNAALNEALKLPEVQEQYKRLGLQLGGGTPQQLGDIIKADTKRWGEVIREAKIPQI